MVLKEQLIKDFCALRQKTEELCQPLMIEDYVIQTIEDVSPPKWHLAHTSWFFECFILIPYYKNYPVFDPLFHQLFNSYYHGLGKPFAREKRGFISRPTVENVYAYRHHVDHYIQDLLMHHLDPRIDELMILGIHHEQQHQELLLMDIKHNLSFNPHYPAYHEKSAFSHSKPAKMTFMPVEGAVVDIGYNGHEFSFDNECPRHQTILRPYEIASRLVTNAEYQAFIDAGGYQDPMLWLSDGWDAVLKNEWQAPLYWQKDGDEWLVRQAKLGLSCRCKSCRRRRTDSTT